MDPTQFIRSTMPLCETLDMTASELAAKRVVVHLAWRPELCTANGLLHGAAGTSTIESKTNFLGAVRAGSSSTASAAPAHVGRTTIVVETELHADDGRLVGKTTQTQSVLQPR